MPRDVNGTYTLAAGNPVVTDTVIQASWANNTLDDLALAMTDSLSRTGLGGISGQFLLDETQTVINPALAFISEPTSGMYRSAPSVIGFGILSTEVLLISGTEITADVPVILSTSTPSVPLEAASKGYVDAAILAAVATVEHDFGSVNANETLDFDWTHGLGTEDIDFGCSVLGSISSGTSRSSITVILENSEGYIVSMRATADDDVTSAPTLPAVGDITIRVDNTSAASQDIIVRAWARVR
jgi:hypothetical protein